jgi:hypothetical protein
MKLEDQLCSLELAKRLKELGIKKNSLFCWIGIENENITTYAISYFVEIFKNESLIKEIYSAFTVAELLEILPLINGCPLQLLKGHKILDCVSTYYARYDQLPMHYETIESLVDINPANTLAKMLIYLIENNLYDLPKV